MDTTTIENTSGDTYTTTMSYTTYIPQEQLTLKDAGLMIVDKAQTILTEGPHIPSNAGISDVLETSELALEHFQRNNHLGAPVHQVEFR